MELYHLKIPVLMRPLRAWVKTNMTYGEFIFGAISSVFIEAMKKFSGSQRSNAKTYVTSGVLKICIRSKRLRSEVGKKVRVKQILNV